MNRQGQVPILMLFAVAIVLVIAALVSFSTFNRNFDDNPASVSKAIAKVRFGYEYLAESAKSIAFKTINESKEGSLQVSFAKNAKEFDRQINDPANNFFKQIDENAFSFEKVGERYRLQVRELFVQAEYGTNWIRRDFSLCMFFNPDGSYIERGINLTTEKIYSDSCVSV